MFSDWDEIKRLAADFQKAQLTSTLQKLSERNFVEIVSLLIENEFVDVIFTNDGKEYVTPDHLKKEIMDELYVNGGRVNLVEVSKFLKMDLSKIESIATVIEKGNNQIHFMLGQLIEKDYMLRIAQEINERLSQKGEISVSDLTIQYDLPSDFLQQYVIEKYIGKIIRGRQDPSNPRQFFTQAYIQRCKAKIRGVLVAITRPTPISNILHQINVQEKMFHSLLEEISPSGNVTNKFSNAYYVPYIYAKMQSDWIFSFYKENGFLEYETIHKLGISDAKHYITSHFPNEKMLFLKKCAVGSKIVDLTLLTALNECNTTKTFVDLSTILPSNMSEEDIQDLFQYILSSNSIPNNFFYLETVVFSNQFLKNILQPCYELAIANAKALVESGAYQQSLAEKQLVTSNKTNTQEAFKDSKLDKRDERRKKASSGKSGGGALGRETKTKATKKQRSSGNSRASAESDIEKNKSKKANKSIELIKTADIKTIISKVLDKEGLEYLSGTIAALYRDEINQTAVREAQKFLATMPQTNRRQTHGSIQDKINILIADIRLYEKGLKVFPTDVQTQMLKYLLKTLGNDICNELTVYIANECNLNIKSTTNLNVEQRNKIAVECDAEYRNALVELNKNLYTTKSIDDFIAATEEVLRICGMIVKKADKKKDRTLIAQHKETLCQQLSEAEDHALILHLTALILFVTVTGSILHASGRFVSQILSFIRPNLDSQQNDLLLNFHDLVLKSLQLETRLEEHKLVVEQLDSLQRSIKALAFSYEKPGVTKAE